MWRIKCPYLAGFWWNLYGIDTFLSSSLIVCEIFALVTVIGVKTTEMIQYKEFFVGWTFLRIEVSAVNFKFRHLALQFSHPKTYYKAWTAGNKTPHAQNNTKKAKELDRNQKKGKLCE